MPFGKGANILGNAPQLNNALGQGIGGVPVSSQVSNNRPFSNANGLPLSPTQLPSPSMPVGQMTQGAQKPPQSEEEMIVKALITRLKTLSDFTMPKSPTQM